MNRLIASLAFILAPIFVSISAEAAVDPLLAAEARRHLEAAALYQEDIAAILNQPTLAAEANQAAAQAAAEEAQVRVALVVCNVQRPGHSGRDNPSAVERNMQFYKMGTPAEAVRRPI